MPVTFYITLRVMEIIKKEDIEHIDEWIYVYQAIEAHNVLPKSLSSQKG